MRLRGATSPRCPARSPPPRAPAQPPARRPKQRRAARGSHALCDATTHRQTERHVGHPAALSVVHPTARAACCPLPRVSLGSRCNPPRRGGHARRATHPSASAPPVGSPMVERRAPMLAASQPASQPRAPGSLSRAPRHARRPHPARAPLSHARVALRPQRGGGSGSVCAGGGQCRRCWCRGRRGAARRCGGVHTLMTRAVLLSRVHTSRENAGTGCDGCCCRPPCRRYHWHSTLPGGIFRVGSPNLRSELRGERRHRK